MDKLKNCPWCKHPPMIYHYIADEYMGVIDNPDIWSVKCINYDCLVNPQTDGMPTRSMAIEAWNERSGE